MTPRPPKQDPEITRQQILAIARRDILRGGIESLSLRAIAREMGYSAGSLYKHFSSKDAIVRTLALQAEAAMRARLAIAPADEPDEQPLVAMGMAFVRTCRENPEDFVLAGLLRTDESRTSLDQEIPVGSPYMVIANALEDAAERGEMHVPDRTTMEYMAYGVWALVQGMANLQTTHLKDFDADFDAADRLVLRALLRGFTHSA